MLNLIFLQAATTAAEGTAQQGGWSFWVMMILIFVVFYFFQINLTHCHQLLEEIFDNTLLMILFMAVGKSFFAFSSAGRITL
mgnify:CR=1 FL=1